VVTPSYGSWHRALGPHVRFIPNIRFGTEGYPEHVARRLRATNIATWIGASSLAFFAVWRFLDGSAHWKYAALVALAYGLAPLLHRFGPLTAPLALVAISYTWIFWISLNGAGGPAAGHSFFYLTAAALGILLVGAERVFLTVVIGAVAAGLIILLHIVMRPEANVPVTSPAFIVAFVVNVLSSSAVLYVIIIYAIRQLTRAEAELELANLAKSRFLAVASHDLRQPLHALGLFVAQLRTAATASERARLVAHVDTAIATMNELFKALLDISKLDAGTLTPNITEFPVIKLLERVETTFARTAADVGLDLRVIPSDAWVRSDFVLLEQVLLNLVSNAVRYTSQGGGG